MNTDLDESERRALALFAASFAKDPEGVAAVFARLQLEEGEVPFEVLNDSGGFSLPREEMELTLVHAGAAGMIEAEGHDDGDGDGPGDNQWMEYRLDEHARAGIARIGARRWIERFIPRDPPALASMPTGQITREEIFATVKFEHVTSLGMALGYLDPLVGTGETTRTIDRGMLAEILCEQLGAQVSRLRERLTMMDDVLSGIESGASQAREILSGAHE